MANRIQAYFHCQQCLNERPADIAPRDWSRLSVGWTREGFQVWCVRHDRNVFDVDFCGQKVEALDSDQK